MMSKVSKISLFILLALLSLVYCKDPYSGVYVTLYPPENVTVAYIGNDSVYVFWYPPPVYLHNYTEHGEQNVKSHGAPETTVVSNKLPEKHVWPNMTYHYGTGSRHSQPKVDIVKHKPSSTNNVTELSHSVSSLNENSSSSSNDTSNSTSGEINVEPASKKPVVWTPWKPKYYTSNTTLNVPDVVSFHLGHLIQYRISWWKNSADAKIFSYNVEPTNTQFEIVNLQPETLYHLQVSAVYSAETFITQMILKSQNVTFVTKKTETTEVCLCDVHGTTGGTQVCDRSKPFIQWCPCREEYAGVFCESCKKGYYRNARGLACYECPCDKKSSTGSCHFEEEYLHCDKCMPGYAGNLCHICKSGYFRYTSTTPCVPCGCHGNAETCTSTGECINCQHNTEGFSCEHCKPDYVGDPIYNKNCTHKEHLKAVKSMNVPLIAGICVMVILVLSGVVGFIVYRRCHSYPVSKPFWTVELKDDHEGVNFSSVPEEEGHIDDLDFYDKKGKGIQKYSPLREDL